MYVQYGLLKNQKQKPLSVSLAPVGKSVSLGGFEFFVERAMWFAIFYSSWYGFVVLVQSGQSMGNTQAWTLFSEQGSSITTSLSQYPYGCTHEPIYPVTFFDFLIILYASCVPLLPFRNTICCSRLFHALSQAPTNTRILTSASIRPTFWKLNQDRQGKKHGPSFLSYPRLVRTRRTRFVHVIATAIPVDIHAHPSAGAGERQQLFTRLWSPLEIFTRVLLAPKAKRRTMQRCWSLGGAPVSPWRSSLWG